METQENFSSFDKPQLPPENNMTLAIVGTVLGLCSPCCIGLILGIISIVFSTQVNSKYNAGDYNGAVSSARNAKNLAYIAIGLGVLGIIINVVLIAINGTDGYREMIENYQRQLGG
jgi:hypothetical protein